MLSEVLKAVGSEVLGYAKEGFTHKLEESVEMMRVEMRETFKEYTVKSQRMMVDTAMIIVLLAVGFYYLALGATTLIDERTGIAGLGGIVLGILFAIFGLMIYKNSRKYIES